jgi:hypothetical protein
MPPAQIHRPLLVTSGAACIQRMRLMPLVPGTRVARSLGGHRNRHWPGLGNPLAREWLKNRHAVIPESPLADPGQAYQALRPELGEV